jgi:hypothetical protein
MDSHPFNRLLVIALALPAAILIAGMAAILDYVFPRGSLLSFLGAMLPMGLVIAGVIVGFVWACDKCERWLQPDAEEALSRARPVVRLRASRGVPVNRFLPPLRAMACLHSHPGDSGHP